MNDFSNSHDRKSSAYRAFIGNREFGGQLGDSARRANEALKARVHGTDTCRNLILACEYVVYVYICPIEADRWAEFFKEWRQPDSAFRPYAFSAIIHEKNQETVPGGYRQIFNDDGDWRSWATASAHIAGKCGFSGSGLVRRIMEKALLECRVGRRLVQPPLSEGDRRSSVEIQGSSVSPQDKWQVGNAARDSVRYVGPASDGSIHFKVLRQRVTHTGKGKAWGSYDRPYILFEPSSVGILRGPELSFDGSNLLQKVFGADNGSEIELPVLDVEALESAAEAQEEYLGKILASIPDNLS